MVPWTIQNSFEMRTELRSRSSRPSRDFDLKVRPSPQSLTQHYCVRPAACASLALTIIDVDSVHIVIHYIIYDYIIHVYDCIVYVIYRYNTYVIYVWLCVYMCNMYIHTQYKIDPRLGQCKTTLICSTFRRNLGRQRLKNSKYLFCHFFVVFVVIFLSFQFCCHFVCHFFCHCVCHFNFVCHFVCHFFCYFNFVCHFVCHFFVIWVLDCRFVCHFFVIFLSFFNQWSIFVHILEKMAPQRPKKNKFSTKWQKHDKQNDNFAGCKNCIFLEALSFFCHFSVIFQTIFDIFPYFSTFLSSKSRLPCLNKKQRSRSLHFIQVISSRPFIFSFGSPCNMLTASHHKALAFETHLSPDTQHSYSKGFAAWTDSFHFHSLTSIHHLISVATVGDDGWPFSDFLKIRDLRLATSCNYDLVGCWMLTCWNVSKCSSDCSQRSQ